VPFEFMQEQVDWHYEDKRCQFHEGGDELALKHVEPVLEAEATGGTGGEDAVDAADAPGEDEEKRIDSEDGKATMADEKRVDSATGAAITFTELIASFPPKTRKSEIKAFWEHHCKPPKREKKPRVKAAKEGDTPEPMAKAKAEPKAKAKDKVEPKARAKAAAKSVEREPVEDLELGRKKQKKPKEKKEKKEKKAQKDKKEKRKLVTEEENVASTREEVLRRPDIEPREDRPVRQKKAAKDESARPKLPLFAIELFQQQAKSTDEKELIDRRKAALERKLASADRVSGVKRLARGDDEANPSDFPAAPCAIADTDGLSELGLAGFHCSKAAVAANSRNRVSPKVLTAEHQVRFPVRKAAKKKPTAASGGAESDDENAEDEVRRKQAMAALKAHNDSRQGQIGTRSSHGLNMRHMTNALLAPKMSFDLSERGEEDEADSGGELEVSAPAGVSRWSLRQAQLQHGVRRAMAKRLVPEPQGQQRPPLHERGRGR
ncbi:unnamed protein product, partial [Polarella glacialis]